MTPYLNEEFDLSSKDLVSVLDELPLWSSWFGAKLLDAVIYKNNLNVLDIGCGTGFPLIELAQRLGKNSRIYGVDVWPEGLERARFKIKTMNLANVTLIEHPAEKLSFPDNNFDLIVSNNGINNVSDPAEVLNEVNRTLKKGAQFLMTVNLPGTMKEFYRVFASVLDDLNLEQEISALTSHIKSKRKTVAENIDLIEKSGLTIKNVEEDIFYMSYADGSSFFNHYFIKLAFLDSWKKIPPADLLQEVFSRTEELLNLSAEKNEGLRMSVPFVMFNCTKA